VRIVFASHTSATGVFRVGSHHLSRELAAAGHDVTHISTPISLSHLARFGDRDVRARYRRALWSPEIDSGGVLHVVPLVVAPLASVSARAAAFQVRHPIRRWRSTLGRNHASVDVLIVDQPLLVDLIDVLRPKTVVYRPTDAHFDSVSRAAEIRIVSIADAVVATSQHVLDQVLSGSDRAIPTMVLENGVEYQRFFRAEENGHRDGIAYLGALDKRFDWQTLLQLAAAFPDERFRIAGPVPAGTPEVPGNVELMGAVPYSEAPDLLHRSRIGLLPMSADAGNAGRSPMKYYEYLAAGLTVVASSSDTLNQRSAPGVWLYNDSTQAIAAVKEALSVPNASNTDGAKYAEQYGWTSRAGALVDFVAQL
jgi:teichuronic acid biosynthesis glycosyltransferase TuaH